MNKLKYLGLGLIAILAMGCTTQREDAVVVSYYPAPPKHTENLNLRNATCAELIEEQAFCEWLGYNPTLSSSCFNKINPFIQIRCK